MLTSVFQTQKKSVYDFILHDVYPYVISVQDFTHSDTLEQGYSTKIRGAQLLNSLSLCGVRNHEILHVTMIHGKNIVATSTFY